MQQLPSVVMFALFLSHNGAQGAKQPASHAPSITPPQTSSDAPRATYVPPLYDSQHPCVVDVRKTPDRTWVDRVSPVTNVLLAAVGIAGVIVAVLILQRIERQTAATEKQATHMVESEGPFIMVETRGDKGIEVWMRNVGKSPAQILFLDPALKMGYPEFVQQSARVGPCNIRRTTACTTTIRMQNRSMCSGSAPVMNDASLELN